MKIIYIFVIMAMAATVLRAQGLAADTVYRPQVQVSGGYVAALLYPGLSAELNYPLRLVKKEKTDSTGRILSRYYKENYVSGQLMAYYHPHLHTNFMLTAHWTAVQQTRRGWFSALRIGFGGARTFYTDPTYTVDAQGNAKRLYFTGDFYGVASLDMAIGYNCALTKASPWRFFMRPGLLLLFPVSSLATLRPVLTLGASYDLGKYWPSRPKYVAKQRLHKPLFTFKKKK